jgi:uncharacterized tellurite resistance protein B-like protein
MTDWKEGVLREYHILERGRQMVAEKMAKNPSLSKLRLQIKEAQQQLAEQEQEYREDISNCNFETQKIKDDLIERWDIEGKSFECDEGGITIRTTRSLKIDNKERLISTLQQIGKLTQCIKGWDLTYLRKLADVSLLDVDEGETNIVHFDEKRNVVISAAKNG